MGKKWIFSRVTTLGKTWKNPLLVLLNFSRNSPRGGKNHLPQEGSNHLLRGWPSPRSSSGGKMSFSAKSEHNRKEEKVDFFTTHPGKTWKNPLLVLLNFSRNSDFV